MITFNTRRSEMFHDIFVANRLNVCKRMIVCLVGPIGVRCKSVKRGKKYDKNSLSKISLGYDFPHFLAASIMLLIGYFLINYGSNKYESIFPQF